MKKLNRTAWSRVMGPAAVGTALSLGAMSPAFANPPRSVEVDVQLLDDVASCDHDGFLDEGEVGRAIVSVRNLSDQYLQAGLLRLKPLSPELQLRDARVELPKIAPWGRAQVAVEVELQQEPAGDVRLQVGVSASEEDDLAPVAADYVFNAHLDSVEQAHTVDDMDSPRSAWRAEASELFGAAAGWHQGLDEEENGVWYIVGAPEGADASLVSPALLPAHGEDFVVSFSHRFDFAGGHGDGDAGGVIELSSDAGRSWQDVSRYAEVVYNGRMNHHASALENREAFVGVSAAMPDRQRVELNFGNTFQGETVWVRFRMAATDGVRGAGWELDDVEMRGLYNAPFPGLVRHQGKCDPYGRLSGMQLPRGEQASDGAGSAKSYAAEGAAAGRHAEVILPDVEEHAEIEHAVAAAQGGASVKPNLHAQRSPFGRIYAGGGGVVAGGCDARGSESGSMPFAMVVGLLGWFGIRRRK